MKLAVWLKEQKKTRTAFADEIGVVRSYVTELCQHSKWPSRDVVTRIHVATSGAVSANDFLIEPAE